MLMVEAMLMAEFQGRGRAWGRTIKKNTLTRQEQTFSISELEGAQLRIDKIDGPLSHLEGGRDTKCSEFLI